MSRVLVVLALVLLIVLYFGGRWFHNTPSHQVAAAIRRGAMVFVGVLLVTLAVTGRLHWLFGVIGGMLPLMQRAMTAWRASAVFRRRSGGQRSPGQTSTVETRFLRMFLHHDTGALSGIVLEGRFQGRAVEDLTHDELMALLNECRNADNDSANVLETYLDRTLGEDWRQRARQQTGDNANGAPMTREEALAILGLEPGASNDEIRGAHRRLMQKLHPDRGGSTYLATKINQAKDLLLA